jgi:hypothetical protein
LFARALKRYYAEDLVDTKDKEKELQHLATIIEEYLNIKFLLLKFLVKVLKNNKRV